MSKDKATAKRSVLLRMDPDLVDQLDARAKERDLSREELIRRMLRWGLKQPPSKENET